MKPWFQYQISNILLDRKSSFTVHFPNVLDPERKEMFYCFSISNFVSSISSDITSDCIIYIYWGLALPLHTSSITFTCFHLFYGNRHPKHFHYSRIIGVFSWLSTGSFAKSHNLKLWRRFLGIIFLLFQSLPKNYNRKTGRRKDFIIVFTVKQTNKHFLLKPLMPLTSNLLVLFQKSL